MDQKQIAKPSFIDLFFQEFEFGGVKAPAAVWGAGVFFAIGIAGTVIWIYQYNKDN